ncbi:MAG: M23 family metallopeptidase [Bacteriovoracaceae bacterium]|nr:M23 family metallopeptidase [Bacteriovoracaceae bacterium]
MKKRTILLLLLTLFVTSCAQLMRSGHYIQLRINDTVERIAKEFQVNEAEILNANRGKKFREGEWWFVPLKRGIAQLFGSGSASYANINYSAEFLSTGKFLWPVPSTTKISSNFGRRWGKPHQGIDIPAKKGKDIIAADDGIVSFSGRMRGYGRIVVLKHAGGFSTVYAHNSKNSVKRGAKVYRGQVVAKIGNSGKSTASHLHFEIRKKEKAVNPMAFIRKSRNYMLAYQKNR